MNVYLIYFSNNYGGACQAFLALKKLLDAHNVNNIIISPKGPVLKPDIEISNNKIISFFLVLILILKNNIIYSKQNNFFFFNTLILSPLCIFKNTALWIHEITLDGRPFIYNFFRFVTNNFVRESFYVNKAMSTCYPRANLLKIPYKHLPNLCRVKDRKRSNTYISSMIVRPLNNKGINKFLELASQNINDKFAILTQPSLFINYCNGNNLCIPANVSVKDFNNLEIREKTLLSSVFHLNLSELPETVGLNTIEAMSYGCLCLSTDNIGSRLILDDDYIITLIPEKTHVDQIESILYKFDRLKCDEMNNAQCDKIFSSQSDQLDKIFIRNSVN